MGLTQAQIDAKIPLKVITGGSSTRAVGVRELLNDITAGYLNKKDGGIAESVISYLTELPLPDRKMLAYVGYVDDAIAGVGSAYFPLNNVADVNIAFNGVAGFNFNDLVFGKFDGTATGDFEFDAFNNFSILGTDIGNFLVQGYTEVKFKSNGSFGFIVDDFGEFKVDLSLSGGQVNFLTNFYNVTGDPISFQGIVYGHDYSANFTARSLVDKAYVDSTTVTADNGLTKTLSNIQLGGALTSDVFITGGDIRTLNLGASFGGFRLANLNVNVATQIALAYLSTTSINISANGIVFQAPNATDGFAFRCSVGNTFYARVKTNNLLANRDIEFPDASGTLALVSQLNDYIPLSGGTPTGLINYSVDLSGSYTARSLVDKGYVDTVAAGLHVHLPAKVATTNTLAIITGGSVVYNNGAAGVGATLTLGVALINLDGQALSVNDRILVKNEATQAHNGIYVYTSSTVLTRASDFDTNSEIDGGDFVFVELGTIFGSAGFVQTQNVSVIGTDPITFQQFSASTTYTNGAGLDLTGNIFSVATNGITDAMISTHTSTKISITAKGQLNSAIVYTDQANTFGNFGQTFLSSTLLIRNPANSFSYIFTASAIAADRALTLPLLTAPDTLAVLDFAQTFTNKTMTLDANTIGATSGALGDLIKHNGTKYVRFPKGTANQLLRVNAGGTDSEFSGLNFTEAFTTLATPGVAATWTVTTVTGAPANSVVMIMMQVTANANRTMGVRAVGSALARLGGVEGQNDSMTMLVRTNGSSQIEMNTSVLANSVFVYLGVVN